MVEKTDQRDKMNTLKIIFSNEDDFEERNVNVKLKRIDDYFYIEDKGWIEKDFDNPTGNIEIKLSKEGKYLLEIKIKLMKRTLGVFTKNISKTYKNIVEVKEEKKLNIDLKKFSEENIQDEKIERVYEEERSDRDKCYICNYKFKTYSDKYICRYCKKNFCSNHRLPEEHKCSGHPLNPKGIWTPK